MYLPHHELESVFIVTVIVIIIGVIVIITQQQVAVFLCHQNVQVYPPLHGTL